MSRSQKSVDIFMFSKSQFPILISLVRKVGDSSMNIVRKKVPRYFPWRLCRRVKYINKKAIVHVVLFHIFSESGTR